MIMIGVLIALTIGLTVVAWRVNGAIAGMLLGSALVLMTSALSENLGRPKPLAWELRARVPEIEVLWWRLAEGNAVYAVVILPGEPEPRLYAFPWSRRLAEDLQALRDKVEKGSRVMIPYPFAPSLERRKPLVPHELPPLALPPKAGDERPMPKVEEM